MSLGAGTVSRAAQFTAEGSCYQQNGQRGSPGKVRRACRGDRKVKKPW